jgi:hypothetical protein
MFGMTDTLIAFLRARLDEDDLTVREGSTSPDLVTGIPSSYADAAVATHITRFAKADRVLREIEAKRRILADYERYAAERRRAMGGWYDEGASPIVAVLAAVYADHPDYKPEWASAA